MAVEPITAVKAAGVVYENRDKIGKVIIGIVAAFCIVLVMISSVATYLVAAPLSEVKPYFNGPIKYSALLIFRKTYGHILNPDYSGSFDNSFNGEYSFPVEVLRISSDYGWRIHPTLGKRDFHNGLDIVTQLHAPIKAIDKGIVAEIGINKFFGRYVMLEHERTIITGYEKIEKSDPDYDPKNPNATQAIIEHETFYSFYGHMASVTVVCKGQEIKKGLVIGTVGGDPKIDSFSGESTGAHLHFGIYHGLNIYSDNVDPNEYMTKKEAAS